MALPDIQQLHDRVMSFLSVFKSQDRLVFSVIVMSAVLVTAARTIAPFEVGHDQAGQLEAAQRLVRGMGMTTTNAAPGAPNDVLQEPPVEYLTDWPPGFSLLVAAFLYIGMPLLSALKIIYGAITLIGWVGWGIIASHFIARPAVYGKAYSGIHLIICALIPILRTPRWGGTDILLWAGIPLVFMCLFGVREKQPALVSVAFAGLLFGSLYAVRYTSLFLGLAATLILFQVSYPRIKVLFARLMVFGVSALTVMLPVVIFQLHARSSKKVSLDIPRGVSVDSPQPFLTSIGNIFKGLYFTSNLWLGQPLLQQVIYALKVNWLAYLTGIISLIIILSLPLFLWRNASANGLGIKDDVTLGLSFLPLSLAVFMLAIAFMTQPYYLRIARYYEPVGLCGIFIFYRLTNRRVMHETVRQGSKAIVLIFIVYLGIYSPALALTQRRDSLVMSILSFTPRTSRYQSTSQKIDYPSFRLYSPKESSREKVRELHRGNPHALFYAENYGHFIYDEFQRGPVPGRSFRPLPNAAFWKRAYTNRPLRIFWVVDEGNPLSFIPDSNKQLVFSDPIERVNILVSDFPEGPLLSANQLAENK